MRVDFEAWKATTQQIIRGLDEKLWTAERETEAARITDVLEETDERIRELSRAKISLLEKNEDKDKQIRVEEEELEAKDSEMKYLKQDIIALC
jgi:hypothetical protein